MSTTLAFQFETSKGIGMRKTLQKRECNQCFTMKHELNGCFLVRKTKMRLDQLDAATSLRDLDLPDNRLEALKGGRKGQFSIR
jgi:plasmid maintenance system killer protein